MNNYFIYGTSAADDPFPSLVHSCVQTQENTNIYLHTFREGNDHAEAHHTDRLHLWLH